MASKKVLLVCSGRESSSDLLLLQALLRPLSHTGVHIDYVAPVDMPLGLESLQRIRPSEWKLPTLPFLQALILPIVFLRYCVTQRYAAVISCSAFPLFLCWPLTLLSLSRRVLLASIPPWERMGRKRRLAPIRYLLAFQDFLGLLAASVVLTANEVTQKSVANVASLLAQKVHILPPTRSCLSSSEFRKQEQKQIERAEVLERYDLPERCTIFAANISEASFTEAERCIRLFNEIADNKRALFLLGQNIDQVSLMAITVGMGLGHQVFFIESQQEESIVSAHVDFYLLVSELDQSSYSLCLARAHGALLIPIRIVLDASLEAICRTVLLGKIADDVESLETVLADKETVKRQRDLQQSVADWHQADWGSWAVRCIGL